MTSQHDLLRRDPLKGEGTIMFLDVRDFATLFDQHDPLEVWAFASTVLSELGAVVEAAGGTIDKFTGDGFLAHFGILEPHTAHELDACRCAVRIREAVTRLNLQRDIQQKLVVSVGIGIHTGVVASGVISTPKKSEFSVFGDVVNLAARIEGMTKEFAVDCLVSADVAARVDAHVQFRKMPHREVRGFRTPPVTFWLLPTNTFETPSPGGPR